MNDPPPSPSPHRYDDDSGAPDCPTTDSSLFSDHRYVAEWVDDWRECRSALDAFLSRRLPDVADREDCLQTVFVRAVEKGGHVPPGLRRAWLFKVAGNEAASFWRRQAVAAKAIQRQGRLMVSEASSDGYGGRHLMLAEDVGRLREAMGKLPPRTQEILRLKFFENCTHQQIADQLNMPLGTTLSTVSRALRTLRSVLESAD